MLLQSGGYFAASYTEWCKVKPPRNNKTSHLRIAFYAKFFSSFFHVFSFVHPPEAKIENLT